VERSPACSTTVSCGLSCASSDSTQRIARSISLAIAQISRNAHTIAYSCVSCFCFCVMCVTRGYSGAFNCATPIAIAAGPLHPDSHPIPFIGIILVLHPHVLHLFQQSCVIYLSIFALTLLIIITQCHCLPRPSSHQATTPTSEHRARRVAQVEEVRMRRSTLHRSVRPHKVLVLVM